jgi:hypothetical protein
LTITEYLSPAAARSPYLLWWAGKVAFAVLELVGQNFLKTPQYLFHFLDVLLFGPVLTSFPKLSLQDSQVADADVPAPVVDPFASQISSGSVPAAAAFDDKSAIGANLKVMSVEIGLFAPLYTCTHALPLINLPYGFFHYVHLELMP